ncbi:MAG: hypothetical protein ACOC33_03815 [bacterium]
MSFLINKKPTNIIEQTEFIKNELLSKYDIDPSNIKINYKNKTTNIITEIYEKYVDINISEDFENNQWKMLVNINNKIFKTFYELPDVINFIKKGLNNVYKQ